MREYGSISPKFWIGKTGKEIRALGRDCQVLAMYLMTSPHSNILGLYYLPKIYICHEVGFTEKELENAISSLQKIGFCDYDSEAEFCWVINFAKHQVGSELKPNDNRVKGIKAALNKLADSGLKDDFLLKYANCYHLTSPPSKPLQRGKKAPPKQLTGTGQEQDNTPIPPEGGSVGYEIVINAYREILVPDGRPNILEARFSGSTTERNIKARFKEHPKHQTKEFWEGFFNVVKLNDFWMGKGSWAKGVNLEWLTKRANFDKVLEQWNEAVENG